MVEAEALCIVKSKKLGSGNFCGLCAPLQQLGASAGAGGTHMLDAILCVVYMYPELDCYPTYSCTASECSAGWAKLYSFL